MASDMACGAGDVSGMWWVVVDSVLGVAEWQWGGSGVLVWWCGAGGGWWWIVCWAAWWVGWWVLAGAARVARVASVVSAGLRCRPAAAPRSAESSLASCSVFGRVVWPAHRGAPPGRRRTRGMADFPVC